MAETELGYKRCLKCSKLQPITEFYKHNAMKSRRLNECRTCTKARAKQWRKDNPERFTQLRWAREIKAKYGVTPDDYYRMLEEQDGRCGGCGSENPGRHGRVFAIDHCHTTGKVRGLLCENCNISLGRMGDSGDSLRGLANYADKNCRIK